jgi:hypothetical protein
MATVSTKLTLDTSGFNRGIKSAESGLSKFKSSAGPAVMAGIAAGFAAAAAAAAGLAVGIKSALDLGGALSDLSTRTGVAAGELRILQEAFARNGLSAEKVGPSINKMQRALVEAGDGTGPAAEAFKMLGISVDGLRGMDASSQFSAIGQAINSIPDPAGRAAAAMQIFGKSGGEMLTLFANSGAMNEAARSVGDQADILTRNANLFDQASDILGSVATKMQGFFVGVADTLVPALMPLLEAADGIDLSGLGQDLGNAIAFGLTVITSGNLGNILSAQLKLSGAQFVNLLVQGITGMVAFLAQRMIDIPADFVTLLAVVTKAEFWAGVGYGLLGAAQKFAAIINNAAASLLEALAKVPGLGGAGNIAAGFRDTANRLDSDAESNLAQAGDALSGPLAQVRDRLSQSFDNAINAAAIAMEAAGETIDTTELQAARDGLVGEITTQMEANREAARSRFEATKTQTPLMDEDMAQQVKDTSGVITDSLQKVGGGGNFARFESNANPELAEAKKQTGLLETSVSLFKDLITATPISLTPALDVQAPALPALKPSAPSVQFPNFAASSDTAAQHLREAQKQTGILQRIFDKIAPTGTLMPA